MQSASAPSLPFRWFHVSALVLICSVLPVVNAADAGSSSVFPLTIENNSPVINVSIGQVEIPVAFDLGGDTTIELTPEALSKITVLPLPDKHVWLDAKGNRLEARKFLIPELRIGSLIFRNVEGHEDAEAANWPKGRAGLGRMGIGLLKPYTILLDYPGNRMGLMGSGEDLQAFGCGAYEVPFDPAWNGEAVSKGVTDIGELTLVWDTGAPMTLIQSTRFGEGSKPGDRKVSQRLVFGGENFGPLELRAIQFSQPEGVDGFLGADFFSQFVVCVDFAGKAFRVRRP